MAPNQEIIASHATENQNWFHSFQLLVEGEHLPEWVTGLSTLMLFITTVLLVIVTYMLAKITREDGLYRRREATTKAWMPIRADIDLPDLKGLDRECILKAGTEIRPLLREIEAFATCVNSQVYDIGTFNRISGGWFVANFAKITPYIQIRHDELPHKPYGEMISLNRDLVILRNRKTILQTLIYTSRKNPRENLNPPQPAHISQTTPPPSSPAAP